MMICAYPVQNHLFSIIAPEHYKLQSIIVYDNDNYLIHDDDDKKNNEIIYAVIQLIN